MFRVISERSWSRKKKLQKIHGDVIGTLEERGMRSFRKREDFFTVTVNNITVTQENVQVHCIPCDGIR